MKKVKKFIPVNVPKIYKAEKINVNKCLKTNWISSEGKFVKDRKLTIRERVEPKNNTAVMFKGNIFHTSSNPIHSDWRIVLNANFTVMPRAELGK